MDLVKNKIVEVEFEGQKHEVELGLPDPLARNDCYRKATKTLLLDGGKIERQFDEMTFDEQMIVACIKRSTFTWTIENQRKLSLADWDKVSIAYKELIKDLQELKKNLK